LKLEKIPLNPPLLKEDLKSSPKQVGEKKSIIRCKLFPAPLSIFPGSKVLCVLTSSLSPSPFHVVNPAKGGGEG
jgi:hypothetical protein